MERARHTHATLTHPYPLAHLPGTSLFMAGTDWTTCLPKVRHLPVDLRLAGQLKAVFLGFVGFENDIQIQASQGKKSAKSIIGLNFYKLFQDMGGGGGKKQNKTLE